jgi:hypothetical protein
MTELLVGLTRRLPLPYAFTFAHRLFAALEIFALAAADMTRFCILPAPSIAESPSAFAAARSPPSCFWSLPTCFSSLRYSCLIAAKMFMYMTSAH